MLPRPSLLKIPDASYALGGYLDPACGGYSTAGCSNKTFTCSPYGSNGAGCIDASYTPPAAPECSWTLGVGVAGVIVTAGGAVIGAVAASPT